MLPYCFAVGAAIQTGEDFLGGQCCLMCYDKTATHAHGTVIEAQIMIFQGRGLRCALQTCSTNKNVSLCVVRACESERERDLLHKYRTTTRQTQAKWMNEWMAIYIWHIKKNSTQKWHVHSARCTQCISCFKLDKQKVCANAHPTESSPGNWGWRNLIIRSSHRLKKPKQITQFYRTHTHMNWYTRQTNRFFPSHKHVFNHFIYVEERYR